MSVAIFDDDGDLMISVDPFSKLSHEQAVAIAAAIIALPMARHAIEAALSELVEDGGWSHGRLSYATTNDLKHALEALCGKRGVR